MDFLEKATAFCLITTAIILLIFGIFTIAFIPIGIKDAEATIKVKERLAKDGIVITDTQITEVINEQSQK